MISIFSLKRSVIMILIDVNFLLKMTFW